MGKGETDECQFTQDKDTHTEGRYSRLQVISVLILSVGIVISALGDAKSKVSSINHLPETLTDLCLQSGAASGAHFAGGLLLLFTAQVLSAFMGLYVEATYTKYGSNWREGLFYTV